MELTAAHWVYLSGIVVILAAIVLRLNVVVPAIAATFLTAWIYTGNVLNGVGSVFNASLTAATELFSIFLIIALMTALLNTLKFLGSDLRMVQPIQKIMVNGHVAFFVLFVVTWVLSLFFWPTPALPLVGAVLIPAAIVAGLPAMAVAMAVAISGQGMALSSDYIMQVAPSLSATTAGVSTSAVADRALVLSLITGGVAIMISYFQVRKTIRAPNPALLERWEREATSLAEVVEHEETYIDNQPSQTGGGVLPSQREKWSKPFAALVPLAFLTLVAYMLLGKFSEAVPDIEGSYAAALVGGLATLLLVLAAIACDGRNFLETVGDRVVEGFLFAFRAMGVVILIAGFFYLGSGDFSASVMGLAEDAKGPSLLTDLVRAGQGMIPQNSFLVAYSVLAISMFGGLDGNGWAMLPFIGSLSSALGPAVGLDPATLAAIGQIGGTWVGGGTLVIWSSVVAVAGFARVSVVELVRKLFVPVIIGLFISTFSAVLIY